MAITAS